jgi:hypothetical protein
MSGGAGVRRAIAVALVVTGLVRVGLAAADAFAGATTSQQVPGGSYGEFTGLTATDPVPASGVVNFTNALGSVDVIGDAVVPIRRETA